MQAVNYRMARTVLRERRFELQWRVRDLAEKAGVERTTIYHLEKIEKEPDHEPDFKTLEKLALAMGLTLSAFFARIEGLKTDSPSSQTAASQKQPKTTEDPRGPAPLPAAASYLSPFVPEAIIIRVAETLAETFIRSIDRLADKLAGVDARRQDAARRPHKAVRDARHRKTS